MYDRLTKEFYTMDNTNKDKPLLGQAVKSIAYTAKYKKIIPINPYRQLINYIDKVFMNSVKEYHNLDKQRLKLIGYELSNLIFFSYDMHSINEEQYKFLSSKINLLIE